MGEENDSGHVSPGRCRGCGAPEGAFHAPGCFPRPYRSEVSPLPPLDWVCPACGAKVGEFHADGCKVLVSRHESKDAWCLSHEVRAPQEGYRKIAFPQSEGETIVRTCGEDLKVAKPEGTAFRRYPPVVKHPEHGGRPMTMDEIADGERGRSRAKTATEVMKGSQYDAAVDNWGGRGAKMRCRTCIWFVGKAKPNSDPLFPQEFGRCRRHAPTLGGWPAVYGSDWCGDHKLDEEKA